MLEIKVIRIGVQGPSGAPGAPGADGADGIQGPQGIQGEQGLPGPDGSAFTVAGAAFTLTNVHRNGVIRVTTAGACLLTFSAAIAAAYKVTIINAGAATITLAAEAPLSVSGILSFTAGGVECARGAAEDVIYSAAGGETNTASNLGTDADGAAVFSGKVGVDLQFKRITCSGGRVFVSATNIDIIPDGALYPPAQAFVDEYSIVNATAIDEIDDLMLMLAGFSAENSSRGTLWTQLPESILGSLAAGHLFMSRFCPEGPLSCLKLAHPMTASGGVVIGANGTVFDGVDDHFSAAASIITGSQWTFIGGMINNGAGGVGRPFATVNNGGVGRATLMQYNTSSQIEVFHNNGTSFVANTAANENSASARLFMTRSTGTHIQAFKNASLTPTQSTACVAITPEATVARYGRAVSSYGNMTGIIGLWFNASINPACYAPLAANLNAILGTSFT